MVAGLEVFTIHAKSVEDTALVLDLRGNRPGQVHEVVDDQANDVEAVGYDAGVGKIAADQAAIRAAHVDADDFDFLPALEPDEKPLQLVLAFTRDDVEDTVIFKVAEGGGKALPFMEGVLVDAEDLRALQGDALGGFSAIEVMVNALDGSRADFSQPGHDFTRDAFVMQSGDSLPEGLAALFSGHDAGKRWVEGLRAPGAAVARMGDVKDALPGKNLQMPDPASLF